MIRWGIVATVKAPAREILNFVAYHLDIGAHRAFIYLDAPDPDLARRLQAHPKVRVFETDETWWRRQNTARPCKHQRRQEHNGQHAYGKSHDLDWLAHIDVDEFLCPERPIDALLAQVPHTITTVRVPPVEALVDPFGGFPRHFKSFHHDQPRRAQATERIYPTHGRFLTGGFLSHVAGKAFIRTGLKGIDIRIHGIRQGTQRNPQDLRLTGIELAHFHTTSWEHWRASFPYRFAQGSYRAELAGPRGAGHHAIFERILAEQGETGLRAVFEEVAMGTTRLRDALAAEGLLRHHDLSLDNRRLRHFPEIRSALARRIDSKPLKPLKGARVL